VHGGAKAYQKKTNGGRRLKDCAEKQPGSHVEIEEFGSTGAFMARMMIYHLASHMGEWV
jgi:hypothetical protein